ncbi:DUF4864 domain-containing protein [Leisingera daeponensis]|uniref:DUF4864 domain-containing protein n=1 Tax=Leisingera daeponensis TaxID=405746 RepID=A0ABS7NKE3_9RHOB|nr:DUF4864 domain-containing protein [Leisingera daeponensis]MBY6141670.1 DUF4864 domain-containing protein [Leisingera daeponensis]
MRSVLFAGVSVFLLAFPAVAQKEPVTAVIGSQFEAFRNNDAETAFTYASPNIRRIFGSPERFGAMVRQGYPMVWRPAEVRYLDLREVAGSLWQRVMITDHAGVVHLLDYQMVNLKSGWKINAVHLLKGQGDSV